MHAGSLLTRSRRTARSARAGRRPTRPMAFPVITIFSTSTAIPQFVGAAVDLYAKLLPVLSTAEGQEFLSTWNARIIGLEDQYN